MCVRSCACVRCRPTVDSLLVPNRRSLPTPWPAASWFPARGAWGGAPSPWEREVTGKRPVVKQALSVLQAGRRTPRASQHGGDGTGPEEPPRGCDWVGGCWRRRRGALGSRLLRPPEPRRCAEDGYGGRFPPAPHLADLRILILNYRLRFRGFRGKSICLVYLSVCPSSSVFFSSLP